MSSFLPIAAAQPLFSLPDAHGALLAEFVFFPEYETLWVRWYGHLTATSVVEATKTAVGLRLGGMAPRRLLSDESQASGDWSEAIPWMQYEWLPNAIGRGLQAMAFVASPDPASTSGDAGFIADGERQIVLGVFREAATAWRWLQRQAK